MLSTVVGKAALVSCAAGVVFYLIAVSLPVDSASAKRLTVVLTVLGSLAAPFGLTLLASQLTSERWHSYYSLMREELGIIAAVEDRAGGNTKYDQFWYEQASKADTRIILIGTTLSNWFKSSCWQDIKTRLGTILGRVREFRIILLSPESKRFQERVAQERESGDQEDSYTRIQSTIRALLELPADQRNRLSIGFYDCEPFAANIIDRTLFFACYLPGVPNNQAPLITFECSDGCTGFGKYFDVVVNDFVTDKQHGGRTSYVNADELRNMSAYVAQAISGHSCSKQQ